MEGAGKPLGLGGLLARWMVLLACTCMSPWSEEVDVQLIARIRLTATAKLTPRMQHLQLVVLINGLGSCA